MQTRMAWFSAYDQHLHHCQLENKLVRAFIVYKGICACERLVSYVWLPWYFVELSKRVMMFYFGKGQNVHAPTCHARAARSQDVW